MLAWIIQISIISIIFIFLVHHLFGFFKSTLTVPKIKDLVNSPTQKYQNIFDTINTNSFSNSNYNSTTSLTDINTHINSMSTNNLYSENSYTAIDLLPSSNVQTTGLDNDIKDNMKNELKSFLKKQLNTNTSSY
jgi:hypothetical protein